MLEIPGVHDGFSARAAELIGFSAVYVGGGLGVATNKALPDMGMVTTDELITYAGAIAAVIDIPVVADLDDGGGSPARVRRAVQQAERAGLAGFHIEDVDYTYGKHFPSADPVERMDYGRDTLVSREAAAERIRVAVEARRNPDTVIIGRTEGALISLDEAIVRARLMADAGADVIYCAHLKSSDTRQVVDALDVPLMDCPVTLAGPSAEYREEMRAGGLKILFSPTAALVPSYLAAWDALEAFRAGKEQPGNSSLLSGYLTEGTRHREWGAFYERHRGPA
ncbi:oxaloacetate decarboxylase [Streptomyces canus]|uniref:isocitrate lyase/PEP mutase family protein n=1 Tax=Streptomyces canus TaxID=58343 RepID=UPI0036A7C116